MTLLLRTLRAAAAPTRTHLRQQGEGRFGLIGPQDREREAEPGTGDAGRELYFEPKTAKVKPGGDSDRCEVNHGLLENRRAAASASESFLLVVVDFKHFDEPGQFQDLSRGGAQSIEGKPAS